MFHIKPSTPSRAALLAACLLGLAGCATAAGTGAHQGAVVRFDNCAKPRYPDADLQAGHQGTVTLGFLVEPDGKASETKVDTSSGFATLDEAARAAIAQCTFTPATRDGKPVREWTRVQYVWTKG